MRLTAWKSLLDFLPTYVARVNSCKRLKVVGSPWFAENTCILFLNKEDLFAEKIKKWPLNKYFDDISEAVSFDVLLLLT